MSENIFISYARHDGESHARKFNADLKALGHETWFDKDKDSGIHPGLAWQKEIQQGIDNCTVFVLVMTPASIQSDNCFAEWSRALGKSKPILPLRMQPTTDDDPIQYDQLPLYIETLQYIDFVDDYDAGWESLTHRLGQLEDEKFQTTQKNARQAYGVLSQFAKGYWLTDADDVPRLADKLIGRDTFKQHINTLLQADKTVLLYGVGGIGKSALASELVADQLDSDQRPILWVEVGNAPIEQVFSAIGQATGIQQEMARAKTDNDKVKLTRDLIRSRDVAWLVIDDAWNSAALTTLLQAIPKRNPIPALITSRQRHIINGELHRVDNLHPDDARQLLTYHMANNKQYDGADDLCRAVGYHPFMLEIAGKLLKQRDISPRRLLEDMASTDLTTLSLPEGVAEAGRENMAKLLKQSLDALPDDLTRAVFLAFGAFPNPTATPEMLALYLHDKVEEMNQYFYDNKFTKPPAPIPHLPNLSSTQSVLNTLFEHGLVRRIPLETRDSYPYNIEYYRVHDLAHTYSANQNPDLERMVTACLAYTWRHNTPSHENFAALRPELDNLVGASTQAIAHERWHDAEQFAWNLASPSGSYFTNYQGYYTEAQTLLTQAASAAEQRGDKHAQGRHLGNLGIAYHSLGDFHRAIEYHQQALEITHKIGNKQAEGSILGNLGLAYDSLGDFQKAIEFHQQYLDISREIGNRQGKGNALGNLGNAYYSLSDFHQAIEYYQQAIEISRELGDKQGEGSDLGNLGIAYKKLGEHDTALDYYQQALDVARELGDRNGIAIQLYNTGILLNDLERYAEAIPLLEESLALVKAMGQHYKIADRESQLNRARKGLS